MGRNCHGPKLTWTDFVMGRNDPEPYTMFHRLCMLLVILGFEQTTYEKTSDLSKQKSWP